MGRELTRRAAPWHQTNWDWRAAGNFVGGGTGTGFLILLAVAATLDHASVFFAPIGLVLVAGGLACVWLEIGRPLRAMNVLINVRTSWMARESWASIFLFAAGLSAVFAQAKGWPTAGRALLWAAALFGLAYLYCQSRILGASKGIPAWREGMVVPLIMITGLTEGAGLLAATLSLAADPVAWIAIVLAASLALRAAAWRAYRARMTRRGAPTATLRVLAGFDRPFLIYGNLVPATLCLAALSASGLVRLSLGAAGFLALAAGWALKHRLVTRAGFNQGFALPVLPVRGRGKPVPGVQPGWSRPKGRIPM